MTANSREIARLERTFNRFGRLQPEDAFPAGNRAAFLQFGVVTTVLFGFVRPRFKVIGIGQPPPRCAGHIVATTPSLDASANQRSNGTAGGVEWRRGCS